MPTKFEIAKYWFDKETFENLDIEVPGCFGCNTPGTHKKFESPKSGWNNNQLQIAHLIPNRSKGKAIESNLVLLCVRCHREAPMIGISAEYVINWINNRESETSWVMSRLYQELLPYTNLFPSLLRRDLIELKKRALKNMGLMDAFVHPGGDGIAVMAAAIFQAELDLQEQDDINGAIYRGELEI